MTLHPSTTPIALLFAVAALAVVAPGGAQTSAEDPAARGLDVFVHAPDDAAPRGLLPVQIEVVGYPTAVVMKPLAGATVEATWDPETLGLGADPAPPVRAVADAAGRVHLEVPVPPGKQAALTLLIEARSGEHRRTRSVSVQRVQPHRVGLHVPDPQVVPGSTISSWVRVQSAITGEPMPRTPVTLELMEGGTSRFTARVTTDLAGMAMIRVPIPRTEEPWWTWDLRATTFGIDGEAAGSAGATLSLREETPGTPRMSASWATAAVRTGDKVAFVVRIRDASEDAVVALPVRTWIGPKGTRPPKDTREWEKVSTQTLTNVRGEVEGSTIAPTTVATGGTTIRLVARARVDGNDLEQEVSVSVGMPSSSAELFPEASSIVPGIEQHMLLRVQDARSRPVSATFNVEGDGLRARVTTDKFGEADITWAAPYDLGARRDVGPCSGGVAAAVVVRPEGEVPALAPRRGPFELCVKVDREAAGLVRADTTLARAGERARVRVLTAPAAGARQVKGPWSVVLSSWDGAESAGAWVEDGAEGAEIKLPPGASGLWSISAVSPGRKGISREAAGVVLVTPTTLPQLVARIAGGRAAPGDAVEVEADLTDGHGRALPGSVSAIVIDLHGGGSLGGLDQLDTRNRLCSAVEQGGFEAASGSPDERCKGLIEGDPSLEGARRGMLGGRLTAPIAADADPGKEGEPLVEAFRQVVRSLEGAVFEATESADRLREARRKGPKGWAFNAELMELVTSEMDPAPQTPGGEPLTLADLVAVDPQVSFDNVARRVTRLKLFRALIAVRAFRRERSLDPDDQLPKDPNVMLRRLVSGGQLEPSMLLDPWGGTMEFVKTAGPPLPLLSVVRGFELRAPGPDGVLGNADDVRDPFARVLRSGTPYAEAVQEDRIVDAKLDMEVGDTTVAGWEALFNAFTGTSLGASGLGLSGIGEGGGGRGEGIGLGSIGTIGRGAGRGTTGIPTGVAFWSPPVRTDDKGRVKIKVPLGDIETTWRIALVAVPDRALPATTTIDVPVVLPLSARVDSGAAWVEGDVVSAAVTVRNRTSSVVNATMSVVASGVAALDDASRAGLRVDVPAQGSATVPVRVRAPSPGQASLRITTRAAGLSDDVVTHTWEVKPAGEPTDTAHVEWVEGESDFGPWLDRRPHRALGPARLVLERGADKAIDVALEALDPDRLDSADGMVEAMDAAGRIRRWATARGGANDPTAKRAGVIVRRAAGRLRAYLGYREDAVSRAALRRANAWQDLGKGLDSDETRGACPPKNPPTDRLEILEAEPAPARGSALACWDTFVSDTTSDLALQRDPEALARAVIALADRPHRAALAAAMADRLRELVALRPSGGVSLPEAAASDRSARSIIYAGLLRATLFGARGPAPAPRLAAWLIVQRDALGGYGSPAATRAAVQALLAAPITSAGKTTVVITTDGVRREIEVGPSDSQVVPLDRKAQSLQLEVRGPGVIARLERPVLRLWSMPPADTASPVHLDVVWPTARPGDKAALRLSVRHDLRRRATVDIRLPLPPGVSLAAPVSGVRQLQGVLAVRRDVAAASRDGVLQIPLRFTLAGRFTVPEGSARLADEHAPRAIAPARPLIIH